MGKVTPIEKKEVKPVIITDNETGFEYTLEFSRATVKKAEDSGFDINTIVTKPMNALSDLWYWALQMHHRNMSKDKTDALLEKCGMTEALLIRLCELYQEPLNSLYDENGDTKNERVTIQF